MADEQLVYILFNRYSDNFEERAWSMPLGGPYEVTNPLQAMVMEAGAKGMSVVINVALVANEVLFPELGEEPDLGETTEESEE